MLATARFWGALRVPGGGAVVVVFVEGHVTHQVKAICCAQCP